MTAEETWKSAVETNLQRALDEIVVLGKGLADLKLMPQHLQKFADNMKQEMRGEIHRTVGEVVGRAMRANPSTSRSSGQGVPFFQKPPKCKEGEDLETFVTFYEPLAKGNKWSKREMAESLQLTDAVQNVNRGSYATGGNRQGPLGSGCSRLSSNARESTDQQRE